MTLSRNEALALLTESLPARRRLGAKRLRALADPTTAAQVRAALERETTWEAKYQLTMALGMTGSREDVELLKRLALQPRRATMVNTALGDSIVRLGRDFDDDPAPVEWCLQQDVELLAYGALRAVAMLRLQFPDTTVEAVLDYVEANDSNRTNLAYWPAIAAAGWSGPRVRAFLTRCSQDSRQIVADAAIDALNRRYVKHMSVL